MIYFTSDLHLGHDNIIGYCNRPFRDSRHMNQVLIDNWNDTVAADDEVYFLGDWCMGDEDAGIEIARQLNGTIWFVPGNHDKCWTGFFRKKKDPEMWREWEKKYLDVGFQLIHGGGTMIVELHKKLIQKVNMCHFPYMEHDNRRFEGYRLEDKGDWLLHGHVHDVWKQRGRQINVGVDVWDYRPVSMDEIAKLILQGRQDL